MLGLDYVSWLRGTHAYESLSRCFAAVSCSQLISRQQNHRPLEASGRHSVNVQLFDVTWGYYRTKDRGQWKDFMDDIERIGDEGFMPCPLLEHRSFLLGIEIFAKRPFVESAF